MNRLFVATGTTLTAVLTVLLFAGNHFADEHTRKMMGGLPAPSNCLSCHAHMSRSPILQPLMRSERYVSPHGLAASGAELYVAAEEAGELLVVSAAERRVVGRIAVGRAPHSIVVGRRGERAYVSCSGDDAVVVVDLKRRAVVGKYAVGTLPKGLALSPREDRLYVANSGSDDISVVETASGEELMRVAAGNNPYAVKLSAEAGVLLATSRLSNPGHFREPVAAEVTVLEAETGRVAERKLLPAAHLVESVDFTPGGDLALVTLVRPKNLVPSTQVGRGWMLTYGLGVLDPRAGGKMLQVLLDEPNAYYADPYAVVVSRDGRRAFVTHAAADCISVIDLAKLRRVYAEADADSLRLLPNHLGLSRRFVIGRIPTGANPKSMALSPDGRWLYVSEQLEDRIAVISVDRLERAGAIDLGGPGRITTARQGARLFHAARAFQGQFSCRSCHPDGDQDAISWDFGGDGLGKNIVNTMTLRDIGHTAPFKWAGTNVSLYMQDGIRFAKHLTRVDPWPPGELKAIVAYIYSIPQTENRYRKPGGALTASQERGRLLFERERNLAGAPIPANQQCKSCHNGPFYTDRRKADVGTIRPTDAMQALDTPQLVNIYDSAPYLHDGSAQTLEEIWTVNSVHDEHGLVSDLNKNQLNDLIEYLRTLGPPKSH